MNLLTVEQLTMTFADRVIFEDLAFTINSEDKIGVIGVNGSGKSTLLKILAGLQAYDAGVITKKRGLRIEYLAQEADYPKGMTVLEAVLRGDSPVMRLISDYHEAEKNLAVAAEDEATQKRFFALAAKMDEQNAWTVESEAKRALTQLGIHDFAADVSVMSGGEKKRVALASSLIQPADLLILDEPTNHLDPSAIEWLEAYLAQYKGALLMVTHDRYFLERVTNVIFELDRRQIYRYEANYARWLELKAERLQMEEASWAKQQNLYRRELQWMRQGAKARSTKQQARIKRFEALEATEAPEALGKIKLDTVSTRLGRKTVELKSVGHHYDADRLFTDFSYLVARDDRLGLIGPNGSGKSTLLKILAGDIVPEEGTREVGSTVKIGYFRQEMEAMNPDLRVIEYIRESAETIETGSGLLSAAQMLELFLFNSALQGTEIKKLSGGEKRRLYLLKVLMEQPNILLLDEPTNDLDIMTLSVLEHYLDDFPGAVIVVSHDRYFLDRVVEHLFAFEGDEVVHFNGDFNDYILASKNSVSNSPTSKPVEAPREKPKAAAKLKFTMAEQHEMKTIDAHIAEIEAELEAVAAAITMASSDYVKLQALSADEAEISARYEKATERWLYLQDKAEQIAQEE